MREIISNNSALLSLSLLIAVPVQANEPVYPDQAKLVFWGEGICPKDYRLMTRLEAVTFKTDLVRRMGPAYATGLADGWMILGSNFNGEIRKGRGPESSWCYPKSYVDGKIPSYPTWNLPAADEVDVQWRVVHSDELFIKPVSYLAHTLGYAWVGGTKSTYVGDDMDITRLSDGWLIKGNNSGSCTGYRCNELSSIKVNNFSYTLEPESFNHGQVTESSKQLVKTVSAYATNFTDLPQQVVLILKYDKATNWSKTDTYGLSEKVITKNKFKWPLVGETEVNIEILASQSWASQKGGATTETVSVEARPTVPPKSSMPVQVSLYKSHVSYPYEFRAAVNYDLTMHGFLRWSGNAWYTHPIDRPTKSHSFAVGPYRDNATSIQYQWDKRYIPDEMKWWDWSWVIRENGLENVRNILGKVLRPIKAAITGDFYAENQFAGNIQLGLPQPILYSSEDDGVKLTDLDIDQESLTREGFGNVSLTMNTIPVLYN